MKVCVFQVQRTEPVPCANLREDLLQRDHPERPSHEGVIQASEIGDGPGAAILFCGRGSNGCKSLTRSVGCERSRSAPRWRPRR